VVRRTVPALTWLASRRGLMGELGSAVRPILAKRHNEPTGHRSRGEWPVTARPFLATVVDTTEPVLYYLHQIKARSSNEHIRRSVSSRARWPDSQC
jgi:hypothetical protein